jgi:hypothetical protein
MSSGWLPKHRQLFFQIFQEGPNGESQVQRVVHSIEQGNLAGLIRILLTIVGIVALALAYVFIEFKGLSAAEGIDQAQIARELAAGRV